MQRACWKLTFLISPCGHAFPLQTADHKAFAEDWGEQELDQVIVTAAPGYSFVDESGDKTALLAAFDLFTELESISVPDPAGSDVRVTLGCAPGLNRAECLTVCYEPGAPYVNGCLGMSPTVWWGGGGECEGEDFSCRRAALIADQNVSTTLGATTAEGTIAGSEIRRPFVYGGVTEPVPGIVTGVEALMTWYFIDVALDKMTPEYTARVKAWSEGLLVTLLLMADHSALSIAQLM